MASYPLLSQAPSPVEVELGCDNSLSQFFLLTLYLHYILNQGAESMIFKVFGKQCANRTNKDWVSTVLNDLEEIGLDVTFADIQEMNKFKRKTLILLQL